MRWYRQVHPDDRSRWSQEAAALFLSGQPLESTFRVLARDGRVVWFQCDARMVHSEGGKPSFIHGVGFDVTELKEAEASLKRARSELELRVEERTRELEHTNNELRKEIAKHKRTEEQLVSAKDAAESAGRIKTEFLANMSHEIRTPMNGVLGLTRLALETDLTPVQREYISLANTSAHSLLRVINQMLDFSKLQSGKACLDVERFDLRASIEGLSNEFKYAAEDKGLTLSSVVEETLPQLFSGDWGRLRQILTNLIGNALKFTRSGGVKLEVAGAKRTKRESGQFWEVRFSVTDTGIGVPVDKTEIIFEAFAQADGSVTREYGGTGLGLPISKTLVEMMGGTLHVDSKVGCGSTFYFSVDLEVAAPDRNEDRLRPGRNVFSTYGRDPGPLRLLVAEDNPVNQKIVKITLEKHGHTVVITNNGQEALDAYQSSSFDLVLMDIQMPIMDGLSAAAAIRTLEAEKNSLRIPIVGFTAHALEADRNRCLAAGMDRHLAKPFKTGDLIGLIDELTRA